MELKPELGSVILRDLRARFDGIPTTGVLAGGAVADWFLGNEPSDIDIFVQATTEEASNALTGVTTASYAMPKRVYDPYGHVHVIASKMLYKVVKSQRDGMINTISCIGNNLSASKIIAGFDLNCTRLGIDLQTERLVWDEEFAFFLKNKQLRISTFFTPCHTAIRYFLKKDRLGCFGDDELEMELLAESWNESQERIGRADWQLVPQFGKEYLAKAKKAADLGLSRYFEIQNSGRFWTLEPKITPQFDLPHSLFGSTFALYGPKVLREMRMKHSKSTSQKIDLVASVTTSTLLDSMLDLFKGGFVRGQVTERAVIEVSSLLNQHPDIYPVLLGANLERQIQIKRRLARFSKRHGMWIYGLVEKEATHFDVVSDDALQYFIDRFTKEYTQPLKELNPLVPSKFLWYSIKELVTQRDLMEEGERMRHCVGGYASSVQSKHVMIFSLKSSLSKHDRSTIEIGQTYQKKFAIFQNRSFANTGSSLFAMIAGIWILSFLQARTPSQRKSFFVKQVFNDVIEPKIDFMKRRFSSYFNRKKIDSLSSEIPF